MANKIMKTLTMGGNTYEVYDEVARDAIDELSGQIAYYKNYVTPQMYGAKGDGETNDTVAIQSALNASSIVYIPDGTYMIDAVNGGIKPKSNQTIILSNNAVLKAITNGEKEYSIISIYDVNNIHISGGKIIGDNATHDATNGGDSGYGIYIRGSVNITVENMEVSDCWGDCIMIKYIAAKHDDGEYYGIQSEYINICNCILHGSRRQGISVVSGINVVIRDCEIYNITEKSPKAGIDIEPDWVGLTENVVVDKCYIHDTSGASIIVSGKDKTNLVKISNCNLDSVNCVYGKSISVNNCEIRSLTLRDVDDYTLVTNCRLSKITTCGGSALVNNCIFENANETAVINSTLDNFNDDQTIITERLSFNNCRFKTNSTATKFLNLVRTTSYSFHQEKFIEFSSCKIDLSDGTSFCNRMPGEELRIDNCDIIVKSDADQAFIIDNNAPSRFIVRNSRITCNTSMNYLLVHKDAGIAHHIEFANNEISNFVTLISCENGATGTMRLINNIMPNENISGTNTIDVFSTSGSVSGNTEDWTFILKDGSTVNKKVVLA